MKNRFNFASIYKLFDILPHREIKLSQIQKNSTIYLNEQEFNNELRSQLQQNWQQVGQLIRYGMSKEENITQKSQNN